jgi:hypothetical protein
VVTVKASPRQLDLLHEWVLASPILGQGTVGSSFAFKNPPKLLLLSPKGCNLGSRSLQGWSLDDSHVLFTALAAIPPIAFAVRSAVVTLVATVRAIYEQGLLVWYLLQKIVTYTSLSQ